MPQQLKALLADLGITLETTNARGRGTLVNEDLLETLQIQALGACSGEAACLVNPSSLAAQLV